MKRPFWLLLTLALTLWGTAGAASNIGFGATTYSKDTLPYNDTLYIYTHLVNYGSQAFYDSISFGFKMNDIININRNLFPNPFIGQKVAILPGDSTPVTFIVVISPSYLNVGPDILVVWPICTDNSVPHDTLEKEIYVIIPTGIDDDNDNESHLTAFYSNQQFFIAPNSPQIHINRVRFFNLFGQQILEQFITGNTALPFNEYPGGLYYAEIIYNNDIRKIIKFMK